MEAYFRLEPEAVFVDDADGKKAILQRLAQRFASVYDLDAVIVPIGGGGLCAGISTAVKLFQHILPILLENKVG